MTLEEHNTRAQREMRKAAESSVRVVIPPQLPSGLGTLQPGRMFQAHSDGCQQLTKSGFL